MKKFILLVVIAALSSMHLCGQTRPPAGTPYMEFNVARNSSFQFKLMGHSKNTDVWVSTSPTNYTHQTISDDWSDYQTVSAGRFPMTVKIYGTIKAIDAGLELTNENNNLASIDVSKNPFLLALSCTNAKVKTLNISENSELTTLICPNNLLTNLDVSQNTKLERFNCANNQLLLLNVANGSNNKLSTFDASGNPSLTCIQVDDGFTPPANWKKDATAQWNNNSANPCPNNYQISFSTTKAVGETISLKIDAAIEDQADVWIDLNNNGSKDDGEAITAFSKTSSTEYTLGSNKVILYGKITHLDCSSNELSSLNISQNTDLTSLICYSNKLSSLDVSQNNKLRGITCSANLLKTLDVSQNAELVNLNCLNNKLSNLDVSQNTKLVTLSCSLNQLASLNIANGNNANLYSFNATNNPNLTCIQVDDGFIPSDTWKKDATAEWNNDSANPCSDPNSYQISFTTTKAVGETIKLGVTAESADQSTIWIDLNNNGIKDVGEAVTSAPILALTEYVLGAQSITLYGKVTAFNCGSNQLSSLDVCKNEHLINLRCNNNSLNSLDVSKNINLTFLYCYSNQLSNLDISQNTNLTDLLCNSNQLSNLDISENIKLKILNCATNLIANLDFSQNPDLTRLSCNSNQLKSLILDQKTKLISLSCQNNQLTSLNVANGNNANVSAFNATNNPNLTCIQVDDGFIPSDTWKKDATAEWNNDSANPCSDPNSYQISFTTTKAVGETIKLGVTAESADQSTIWIDLNNNGIKDVGEAVTSAPILALTEYTLGAQSITLYGKVSQFNCGSNQISSLDVSQNISLHYLYCNDNQLSSLDVSKNINLTMLYCYSNQLSNLNISTNINLTSLICSSNLLSTLDISENIKLATLNCAENLIANLDFSQNPALTRLFCNGNQLKSLILDQKTKLISLSCQDNQLTSLNVANGNNANVTAFNATGNPNLTCIQVDDGFIPSDTWKKDAAAEWNNDSANPCVPIVVGINDLILNRVKIYPNPAKETLYILSDVEVLEVELFNMEGRLILKQNHSDAISIGHLPGGIYQVVIFTDNGVYTEKMIKQ